MDQTYFNPHSQSESDFLANFVARQSTLRYYLGMLRQIADGGPVRHQLIVAPRGFGKTSLLRRLAISVRLESELRGHFIALTFREEQHNVISLDVFWRNCLQALHEAREDELAAEPELAALQQAWDHHPPRQALSRDEQDGEPAWLALQAHCASLGRRPLLLIDNLDALLAGLSTQHQWGLRKLLQSEDGPVLIAAASRYPATVHDAQAPFYEFFSIQGLDKLNNDEVLTCLRTLASLRGVAGQPVLALLSQEPGRVSALNTLAGGSPRTLAVLYRVLESHMSADVLSQLSAMLDTFTGWYQARVEELPLQARAVFDALALNWNPMTAAAVGQTTGLDTPSVGSQLSRLEKAGYVEPVALSSRGKGRNGYQVSERFFNIWYLMRNGPRSAKKSIRFLTLFLQSCFSLAQRHSLARAALKTHRIDLTYTVALASSLRRGVLRQHLLSQAAQIADRPGADPDLIPVIDAMQRSAAAVPGAAPLVDGLAELDAEITQLGAARGARQRHRLAVNMVNRGVLLGEMARVDEEIQAYQAVVKRFDQAREPLVLQELARALRYQGVAFGVQGRIDEAFALFDGVVARFGADNAPPLLRWQVAEALFSKAVCHGRLGELAQELAVYDEVASRFGHASELMLREPVARAMVYKALTLAALNRTDQALTTLEGVIASLVDCDAPQLQALAAQAWAEKAALLAEQNRFADCEHAYAQAIQLAPQLADVWISLGNSRLDRLGDPGGALAAFTQGLALGDEQADHAISHLNLAYVLVLHGGDLAQAHHHARSAIHDSGLELPPAGRCLLEALLFTAEGGVVNWPALFEKIDEALALNDPGLWSDHLDDLLRLLWFIISQGQAEHYQSWMTAAQYQLRYAPLYHAWVASLQGVDHLFHVNPEVRVSATRLQSGLARLIALYGRQASQRLRS